MLKPPAWAKNAKPTTRGWVNPKTNELLVARRHSDREVEEYHLAKANEGVATPTPMPEPAPAPAPIIEADPEPEVEETAEMLIEAEPDVDHWSLTKAQLVEHAAEAHGIELDSSMTKSQMIEELEAQI